MDLPEGVVDSHLFDAGKHADRQAAGIRNQSSPKVVPNAATATRARSSGARMSPNQTVAFSTCHQRDAAWPAYRAGVGITRRWRRSAFLARRVAVGRAGHRSCTSPGGRRHIRARRAIPRAPAQGRRDPERYSIRRGLPRHAALRRLTVEVGVPCPPGGERCLPLAAAKARHT